MYSEDGVEISERVRQVAAYAHPKGVAVEAEMAALPGVSQRLTSAPESLLFSDPVEARAFVERTGVDALAVNVGQVHLHGRQEVRLNLSRLEELKREVAVPLVLHGATSVARSDLQAAIALGIRKINVGSILKRTYFEALRRAAAAAEQAYNPYDVVGSGPRR